METRQSGFGVSGSRSYRLHEQSWKKAGFDQTTYNVSFLSSISQSHSPGGPYGNPSDFLGNKLCSKKCYEV